MGKIILEKMEFHARHGVYDLEKVVPQLFLVSLTIETDMIEAGRTDRLNNTVDYQKIVDICKKVMDEPKSLIEKIALEILSKLHDAFPAIKTASVKVDKPEAQLGIKYGSVSVTVTSSDLAM